MRYALGTFLGVMAASVLVLVSAAMNWRFGYFLGKEELDSQIYGAASAASDGLKVLLPFIVLWAIKQRAWVQASAGSLVWVICTVYSLTSALGFAAQNRADTMGERVVVANEYKDLRADLSKSMKEAGWIPQHRPVAAVEADVNATKQHYRWRSTKGCTNATVRPSIKFCNQYRNLEKELAFAKDGARLSTHIAIVRAKLDKVSSAEAASEGDPQVAILSRLTGVDASKVQLGLVLLVALLVEIGSGLGFFVVLGNIRDTRPKRKALPAVDDNNIDLVANADSVRMATLAARNDNVALPSTKEDQPIAIPELPAAKVVAVAVKELSVEEPLIMTSEVEFNSIEDELRVFYDDRIERAEGSSITASTLYENYCVWAEKKDREPMTLPAFGRKFSELGIQKAKIAGRIRYIGVKLTVPSEEEILRSSKTRTMAA